MKDALQTDAALHRELVELNDRIEALRPIAKATADSTAIAAIGGGLIALAAILVPLIVRTWPW